jgi:hypothetical protein
MTEYAAHQWLLEQLQDNKFKPLSEPMPWKPMSIAEMREQMKRPPLYQVDVIPNPSTDWS